jgi:hypothetical protein
MLYPIAEPVFEPGAGAAGRGVGLGLALAASGFGVGNGRGVAPLEAQAPDSIARTITIA